MCGPTCEKLNYLHLLYRTARLCYAANTLPPLLRSHPHPHPISAAKIWKPAAITTTRGYSRLSGDQKKPWIYVPLIFNTKQILILALSRFTIA